MRKLSMWLLSLMLVAAMAFGVAAAETQNSDQAIAQIVETGVYHTDLSDAMQAATDGQTVRLLKDTQEVIVTVKENTTLDLNGHALTATYASVFGYMVDNSTENTGVLKVDEKKLLINTDNSQLPVMTEAGYQFVEVVGFHTAWMNENTFVFQPLFEKVGNELLKGGVANTGVSIQLEVSWKPFADSEDLDSRTFKYGDTLTGQYFGSYNAETGKYGRMFTLTLVNPGNYVDLSCHCKVVSNTRVEFAPEKSDYLTEEVYLTTEQASAIVPAGTKLTDSDVSLGLTTTEMEKTTSDVVLSDGETMLSMDVHVDGIAEDNTVPVIVTLNQVTFKGLNEGNIKLYHVENGLTNEMTRVFTIEEVDAHNEYYYDIATGTITMALKSFSEVAVVADEIAYWEGTIDTSWYSADKTAFEIFNADQLAGLGALVDGGNTFEGKTVTLCLDVYLSDGRHQDIVTDNPDIIPSQMFNPIGYSYAFKDGQVFKGTFDGNGNTIYNMFQQGWDMEATYNNGEDYTYSMAGAGLFASIENATIKNLTMDNAFIAMECVDMGVVVGYANGNCTFENIVVKNSLIANYQRYTGGVIGEVGNGHHTLTNVDVEATTTVSSLWGDFDTSLGGIIGGKWGHTYTNYTGMDGHKVSVAMDSCDVAATINAYNDVTSAYQWYSYRRAGMLIGNSEESKTVSGRTEAAAPYLVTTNCTIQYGDWVNYTYCEFGSTTSLGARYPWVRVQPGYSCGAFSNPRYGVPTFDGKTLDVANHATLNDCHNETDGHLVSIPFQQLYGGGQGCYGGNGHLGKNSVVELSGVSTSKKFEITGKTRIINTNGTTTIKLGELFKAMNGADIKGAGVYAYVTPANKDVTVRGSFVSTATENWADLELTITGTGDAIISISDYYYCIPTVAKVSVSPCCYTVTYMEGDTVLYVDEVTDNTKDYTWWKMPNLAEDKYQWVNAGSSVAQPIVAGNTNDVTVYLDRADEYIVRFLYQDGTVYQSFKFNNQTGKIIDGSEPAVPAVSGLDVVDWESYTLKGAKGDISVKPVYQINQYVQLEPIDDNQDGAPEAYRVTGGTINDKNVDIIIPESVNGIPVTQIKEGAFTNGKLRDVYVPNTITDIGKNAFCKNDGFIGLGGEHPQIQIIFDGTREEWMAVNKVKDWDDNIGSGSVIIFTDSNSHDKQNGNNFFDTVKWENQNGFPDWYPRKES